MDTVPVTRGNDVVLMSKSCHQNLPCLTQLKIVLSTLVLSNQHMHVTVISETLILMQLSLAFPRVDHWCTQGDLFSGSNIVPSPCVLPGFSIKNLLQIPITWEGFQIVRTAFHHLKC